MTGWYQGFRFISSFSLVVRFRPEDLDVQQSEYDVEDEYVHSHGRSKAHVVEGESLAVHSQAHHIGRSHRSTACEDEGQGNHVEVVEAEHDAVSYTHLRA